MNDEIAGSSAQAEYDRRAGRHAKDLRKRRARILAYGIAVAVIGPIILTVVSPIWGAVVLFDVVLVMSCS